MANPTDNSQVRGTGTTTNQTPSGQDRQDDARRREQAELDKKRQEKSAIGGGDKSTPEQAQSQGQKSQSEKSQGQQGERAQTGHNPTGQMR